MVKYAVGGEIICDHLTFSFSTCLLTLHRQMQPGTKLRVFELKGKYEISGPSKMGYDKSEKWSNPFGLTKVDLSYLSINLMPSSFVISPIMTIGDMSFSLDNCSIA